MKVKVGLLQLNSGPNKENNLTLILQLIQKAAGLSAAMCFLPEGFAFLNSKDESYECIDGPFM